MKVCVLLACGMAAGAISLSASAQNANGVVAFPTSVKVVVDDSGRPAQIEAATSLPQGIREFVEARARDLSFEPAMVNGRARGGTTYVVFGVCAVPSANGMQVAADYRGHGPGQVDGAAYPAPPRYPVAAVRQGLSVSMTVDYVVQPDGRAALESIAFADGTRARAKPHFERMARDWVGSMRVLPELVDGEAISSHVSTPVTLETARVGTRHERDMLRRARDSVAESAECLAAEQAQPGQQVVTAESAFAIRSPG